MVSLEFSGWCMVLSSPPMSLLGRTSGGLVAVTSGPFLWHVGCASRGGTWCGLSFGSPGLLWVSPVWKHRDLKEGKALSQPWVGPKAQPKGLGGCRLRWDGVNMEYRSGSGVGVVLSLCLMGSAGICSLSLVQIWMFPLCLSVLELFHISHVSLELCWLGLWRLQADCGCGL